MPTPVAVVKLAGRNELIRISILTKESQSDSRDLANSPQRIPKAPAPRTPFFRAGTMACAVRALLKSVATTLLQCKGHSPRFTVIRHAHSALQCPVVPVVPAVCMYDLSPLTQKDHGRLPALYRGPVGD